MWFGCDLLMDDPIIFTDRGANMKAAFNGSLDPQCDLQSCVWVTRIAGSG